MVVQQESEGRESGANRPQAGLPCRRALAGGTRENVGPR